MEDRTHISTENKGGNTGNDGGERKREREKTIEGK